MFVLRSISPIIAAAALGLGCIGIASANDTLPGPIPATVVRIVDGDTIEVSARIWLDQIVTVEVRLAGVNAAETFRPPCEAHRDPGLAATAFVTELSLGEVALFDVEQDKYGGRVVARVVMPDGRDVSALLLDEGHAWPYGDPDPLCLTRASAAADD